MNTRQLEYKTDTAQLAKDATKRETRLIGFMVAIAVAIAALLKYLP